MSNSVHMPVWMFVGSLLIAGVLAVLAYRKLFR